MDVISLECPAKINLSLDVIGKREDGYHDLKMIMQSVCLFDKVTLKKSLSGINISCNNQKVPVDQENICYKTAQLMFERFELKSGLDIIIDKRIPIAAGLAGGSTDAAGVIEGINLLYELRLDLKEMMEIGLKVGADVPFCLHKGTALAEGVGERITKLDPVKAWCVLAKPSDISVSTKDVFGAFRNDEVQKRPNTEMMIEYIKNEDLENLSESMVNVLETVTIREYPKLLNIKNIMIEFKALGCIMSGSGPTVFGLFRNKEKAEVCYHRLKDYLEEAYLVETFISEE